MTMSELFIYIYFDISFILKTKVICYICSLDGIVVFTSFINYMNIVNYGID